MKNLLIQLYVFKEKYVMTSYKYILVQIKFFITIVFKIKRNFVLIKHQAIAHNFQNFNTLLAKMNSHRSAKFQRSNVFINITNW